MQRLPLAVASLALSLSLASCSSVDLDALLEAASNGAGSTSGSLDRETVVAGLKEALEIGSGRAIDRTGEVDGFLANELIRIATPPELEKMTQALRSLGLNRQVDELEIGMNRAAEQAVGEAREILWTEIRALSFPDAMALLGGGDTAATDFLEERTADEIRSRFEPIVAQKIETVGLGRLYGDLARSYNRLPFVTSPAVDLTDYVTDEALDGLFKTLAAEETKIRREPIARTTELLRKVFSNATQ